MPHNNFRLVTLGRIALLDPDGGEEQSLTTRRRKLTLLAVLALNPRPLSRDTLVEMFWGDEADDRARHSLADALSHLRRVLGRDALTTRREDVGLAESLPLSVDAWEIAEAARRDDWTAVLEGYTGEFLAGVHVSGSAALEQWIARERDRLRLCFLAAASRESRRLLKAGDRAACERIAERWTEADPLSEEAALTLLRAIASPGGDEADRRAIARAEQYSARLRREFELPLPPAVASYLAELNARVRARHSPPVSADRNEAPTPSFASPPRRKRGLLVAAAAVLLLAGAGVARLFRTRTPAERPVVAVVAVRNGKSDARRAWIAEGLPQMIAAALSRSPDVEVVSPERLRDVRVRGRIGPDARLDQLIEVGRRAGAGWAVTGSFVAADSVLVLTLEVHETGSGKLLRLYTVAAADPLRLADQAAARLVNASNAGGPGPRLAEMETENLEAYEHFVRATQAQEQGRFAEALRELESAVLRDSGFVAALRWRLAIAKGDGDSSTRARLERALQRNAARASEWDRMELAAQASLHAGERDRAEGLARALVARFQRDPRAYAVLADVYINHGRWDAADTVLLRELALDSLALEAGSGPCAPCVAYSGLGAIRYLRGDFTGGIQAARRWVELQPELPAAWANLSAILSFAQRFDEAEEAAKRAIDVGGPDLVYRGFLVRLLLMERRYSTVDSITRLWLRSSVPNQREAGLDLAFTLLREQGRYRESVSLLRTRAAGTELGGLTLVLANSMARNGALAAAERIYQSASSSAEPSPGDDARAFAWHHALLATVVARAGDTARLAALADTIERVGNRSYYGRDWGLHEHVRGILALWAGKPAEAVSRLERARWGRAGWAETNLVLSTAYQAVGRHEAALAVLRDAYGGPLDAMGRYVPRSELDYAMANALLRAGRPDSAAFYQARLHEAWAHADPEPRRRLAALDLALRPRRPNF